MGSHVQCPKCDQAYALSDEQEMLYAGREFECTQCNARFVVPRKTGKSGATGPLRGELPREQVTAGAITSPAHASTAVPSFAAAFAAGTPPMQASYSPADFENIPGSGLATASLICGVIGMLVPIVPALLAILLGAIALVRIQRGKAEGASLASGGIALGFAGLVVGTAIFYQRILPYVSSVKHTTAEVKCADHFKTIDAALTKYAATHQGHFPDGLEALVADDLITPDAFICSASSDTKAEGASKAEIVDHLRNGNHSSYIYTGKGLTNQSPAECVLLYEPLDRHNQDGISVLFADHRIQTIGKIESAKAIANLNRGQNPPWSD